MKTKRTRTESRPLKVRLTRDDHETVNIQEQAALPSSPAHFLETVGARSRSAFKASPTPTHPHPNTHREKSKMADFHLISAIFRKST